jgi:hypothetical protein
VKPADGPAGSDTGARSRLSVGMGCDRVHCLLRTTGMDITDTAWLLGVIDS